MPTQTSTMPGADPALDHQAQQAAEGAALRAEAERAPIGTPVTAQAPGTRPAAAEHAQMTSMMQPQVDLSIDGDLAHRTPILPYPSPEAERFATAVRAERKHHGYVSDLLHHPDSVVRARAAEAVASLDTNAADAGILSRAAVDTARQLDRAAGRVDWVRPSVFEDARDRVTRL